jgi:hypothetical protein
VRAFEWHVLVALGALRLAWLARRDAHWFFAVCWVIFAVGALANLTTDV